MFVFLPIIHRQAHKSPQSLYKQSRKQSAEDNSSLQTCLRASLCCTRGKEWWNRSRSFFSCELSLTAFSLANTVSVVVWAKPQASTKSLWEEKGGIFMGLKFRSVIVEWLDLEWNLLQNVSASLEDSPWDPCFIMDLHHAVFSDER